MCKTRCCSIYGPQRHGTCMRRQPADSWCVPHIVVVKVGTEISNVFQRGGLILQLVRVAVLCDAIGGLAHNKMFRRFYADKYPRPCRSYCH